MNVNILKWNNIKICVCNYYELHVHSSYFRFNILIVHKHKLYQNRHVPLYTQDKIYIFNFCSGTTLGFVHAILTHAVDIYCFVFTSLSVHKCMLYNLQIHTINCRHVSPTTVRNIVGLQG